MTRKWVILFADASSWLLMNLRILHRKIKTFNSVKLLATLWDGEIYEWIYIYIFIFWVENSKWNRVGYLSLTKLAFAKQSKPDLTRMMRTPGVLRAIGYWWISQKVWLPGSFPNISVPGLIEITIIFANDITNCNNISIYLSLTKSKFFNWYLFNFLSHVCLIRISTFFFLFFIW